jgi:hypothetical protein
VASTATALAAGTTRTAAADITTPDIMGRVMATAMAPASLSATSEAAMDITVVTAVAVMVSITAA